MHREPILDYTRPSLDPRTRDAGPATAGDPGLRRTSRSRSLAVAAFHLPGVGVTGQEMSLRRTVFAAVNATTLTGFQQDVGSSLAGADVLRLVLTLGGTLFALTAGGMAVVRIARMNYTDGQVARAAAVATLAATVAGRPSCSTARPRARRIAAPVRQRVRQQRPVRRPAAGRARLAHARGPAAAHVRRGARHPRADGTVRPRHRRPADVAHSRTVLVLAAGFYLAGTRGARAVRGHALDARPRRGRARLARTPSRPRRHSPSTRARPACRSPSPTPCRGRRSGPSCC